MRNLAGIVFEDCLRCFAGWGVKKYDRCHVLPKWFSNAGNLLCQHPHAYTGMEGTAAEIDQLTCATFFTSFEAAQSSRTKSVFVFSKK